MLINSCCFTGHRPAKLPWKYDTQSPAFTHFYLALARATEDMADKGCTIFYTGMAEGVDLWAADIILRLRETLPEKRLKLIAVCPCRGQELAWGPGNRKAYRDILTQADEIVVLYDRYTPACMRERNAYMLARCGHLVAGYDGKTPGGTRSTVEAALRRGMDVAVVNPINFY